MEHVKLSAIVLAKNEESSIEKCLHSLKLCDEVLVIDDHSSDRTAEIAKKCGAEVFKHDMKSDFAAQRNFGASKARGEWLLYVDADEVVSEELAKEIYSVLHSKESPSNDSYYIRRRDVFWNHELRYGETMKARNKGIIRMMKKESGAWHGTVHEEFIPVSKPGTLQAHMLHYPHQSIRIFLREINLYSSQRAREMLKKHSTVNTFQLIAYPMGKFLLTYFIYLGFLDGAAGFAYSFLMSFHSFMVRAKLYQYAVIGTEST